MSDMLQGLKEGNRKVFHDFYFEHHARLYHYILKYTRSEWLAEETVQLSFVKLWETRKALSASYSLSTQLYRIAKSILIDLLRKNVVRKTESLHEHIDLCEVASVPEKSSMEAKDELNHVLAIIRKMPPMQQKVFSYSRLDNFSHKEIAEKLSISTKTIETHIGKAVKRIKKSIPLFFFL